MLLKGSTHSDGLSEYSDEEEDDLDLSEKSDSSGTNAHSLNNNVKRQKNPGTRIATKKHSTAGQDLPA